MCLFFSFFFSSAVDPVLVKATKDGVDKYYSIKNKTAEIECITERSHPPAVFSWRYQLLHCTAESSNCPLAKPDGWQRLSFGKVEGRFSNTSVLIVPGHIKNMYFKCTAVNQVTRAKDSKQYQFIRIPRK